MASRSRSKLNLRRSPCSRKRKGRSDSKRPARKSSSARATGRSRPSRARASRARRTAERSRNQLRHHRHTHTSRSNRSISTDSDSDHQYPNSSPGKDVELLPAPIKSPNDDNRYRAIRLKNGLTAILIEDREEQPPDSDSDNDNQDDEDSNCIDIRVGKFNLEVLGLVKQDCCDCVKKGDSIRTPKYKKKKPVQKQIQKKQARDGRVRGPKNYCRFGHDLSTFSLSVGAGSYHEPADLLGLAHLTEHCVFLGSERYPESDTLDNFLAEQGGELYGTTEGNNTTFTFTVTCDKLLEALEIFVESLKKPLLRAQDVVKERDTAVDTEFKDKKDSDDLARLELLQTTAKRGHVATRFGWGTSKTLQTKDKRDETLAARVREFVNEHYTVDNITIALQATTDLDTLQEIVVDLFSHLKPTTSSKRQEPLNDVYKDNPYDTDAFKKWYDVIPHKTDATELILTWAFPPEDYRTKPLRLVGHYLCNEYGNGLAHYLRSKYWIKSIEARPASGDSFIESNEFFTLFSVTLVLTKRGAANCPSILQALFAYISFLRRIGPQTWHSKEVKQISALEFHFHDELRMDPIKFCKYLAKNVKCYGSADLIGGDLLYYDWNPELVQQYLD